MLNLGRAILRVDRVDLVLRQDLVLVYLSSFVAVSGITLLAPILPTMMTRLQATEATIGLVLSIFTLPSLLLTPVVSSLADSIGRKPIMCGGLVIFGIAGIASAFMPTFGSLLGMRLVQGIGYACVMPLTVVLIGDFLSGAEEVTGQGLRGSANAIAESIFPLAGGALVLVGWHYPFLVYAMALPLAVLMWRSLSEPLSGSTGFGAHYFVQITRWAIRYPNGVFLFVGMSRFMLKFGLYIYLPIHVIQGLGLPIWQAGALIAVTGVLNAVAASQAGWAASRLSKVSVLAAGFAVSAGALVLIPMATTFPALVVLAMVLGASDGLIGPFQRSVLTQASALAIRGGIIGANHIFVSLGKTFAAPLLGLVLLVGSVPIVFFAMAALAVVSAALLVPARKFPAA